MKKNVRFIFVIVTILYLTAVVGATVYSQTGYQSELPVAYLTKPGNEEIPFILDESAIVKERKVHYLHPNEKPLPNDVIIPGQPVEISSQTTFGKGQVLSIAGREQVGGAEIWIEITEGFFSEDEQVNIRIVGETRKHEGSLPRKAVKLDVTSGKPCIYTVETIAGPWGDRYVLKQRECSYVWPYNDDTTTYVLVPVSVRNSGSPIVVETDPDVLYDSMEVRLNSWEGE